MTRPIIGVDLDDVLAANAEGFVAFSNQQWGTNLTINDYDEHWMEVWGVDLEETLLRAQYYHDMEVPAAFKHDTKADRVLRHLAKRYELKIVTSRRKVLEKITHDWLDKHYKGVFDKGSVHFAGIWDGKVDHSSIHKTKADVVQALGIDYLIDDQLKHCQAVADRGKQAVLFGDYTWNQASQLPSGVVRCKNWQAVRKFFDER